METKPAERNVIPRNAVRVLPPALIDCASASAAKGAGPLVVVPLLDGDRVAGLEVRCGCGATAVIECIYAEEQKP